MSDPLASQAVKPGQVYKSNESHRRDNAYRTIRITHVGTPSAIYRTRLHQGVLYAWGVSTRRGAKPVKVTITVARLLSKDFSLIVEHGDLARKPEQPFPTEATAA